MILCTVHTNVWVRLKPAAMLSSSRDRSGKAREVTAPGQTHKKDVIQRTQMIRGNSKVCIGYITKTEVRLIACLENRRKHLHKPVHKRPWP